MARPLKNGLDYFALDVDIDGDDKICLIEAEYGLAGFAILLKLLMAIYREGYFKAWGEKEELIFSRRKNIPLDQLRAIVAAALKWDFFSADLYAEHGILTSHGIQLRYLSGCQGRTKIRMREEYRLFDLDEIEDFVRKKLVFITEDITPDNQPETPENNDETPDNGDASTQRNERKERNNMANPADRPGVSDDEQSGGAERRARASPPESFEKEFDTEIWPRYPRKVKKKAALRCYQVRRRGGATADELATAVRRYAAAKQGSPLDKIMHGSTFFGPDEPWEDYLPGGAAESDVGIVPREEEKVRQRRIRCPACDHFLVGTMQTCGHCGLGIDEFGDETAIRSSRNLIARRYGNETTEHAQNQGNSA